MDGADREVYQPGGRLEWTRIQKDKNMDFYAHACMGIPYVMLLFLALILDPVAAFLMRLTSIFVNVKQCGVSFLPL